MKQYVQSGFIRMHPFTLLLYIVGAMFVTMATLNPILVAVSFITAAIVGSFLCGKQIWKSAFCLFIPVFVFSAGILPLFSHQGITPLFYIHSQAVTWESVFYGVSMSGMLVAVYLWFQIAAALLDGEKILFLFGKAAPSLGLLVSMIFRMLPLLKNRFREIRDAQKGLGFYENKMNFLNRCRQWGKEFSILVSWSLESAVETSVSMESRGYGTGRRTSFHLFRIHKEDVLWCILFCVLFGITMAVIVMGYFSVRYFPAFHIGACSLYQIIGIAAFMAATVLPIVALTGDFMFRGGKS